MRGTIDALEVGYGHAVQAFHRCSCHTDESHWQEALDLIEAVLDEAVVAVSLWRDDQPVVARLMPAGEAFVQHGHPAEPARFLIRSWRGSQDDGGIIKSMRTVVVCDEHGFEELRRVAQPRREQLEGADCSGVVLTGTQFVGVNLRNVEFYWAGLYDANFTHADLRGAHLQGTTLRGAIFRNADLRGADLGPSALGGGTNLDGADLTDARLEGARLDRATFTATTVFPRGFDPARAGMVRVGRAQMP